jgi:hypothetical protein
MVIHSINLRSFRLTTGIDGLKNNGLIRPLGGVPYGEKGRPEKAKSKSMPAAQNQPIPERPSNKTCQHPRVQVVAREEDQEFVECLECREVFDSSEFRDMSIEEEAEEDLT